MATQEKIDELTAVIQACLEQKMQDGFDANSALTTDIFRELSTNLTEVTSNYTDVEIAKVKDTIQTSPDLGPFNEFMVSVRTLLGDDGTGDHLIFNQLVADTVSVKEGLATHEVTLTGFLDLITSTQAALNDHEQRIAVLEELDHEHADCTVCNDELLDIYTDVNTAACTASATTNAAFYNVSGLSFVNQMNVILNKATVSEYIRLNNGALLPDNGVIATMVNASYSATIPADDTYLTVTGNVYGITSADGVKVVALLPNGIKVISPVHFINGSYTYQYKTELLLNTDFSTIMYVIDANGVPIGLSIHRGVDLYRSSSYTRQRISATTGYQVSDNDAQITDEFAINTPLHATYLQFIVNMLTSDGNTYRVKDLTQIRSDTIATPELYDDVKWSVLYVVDATDAPIAKNKSIIVIKEPVTYVSYLIYNWRLSYKFTGSVGEPSPYLYLVLDNGTTLLPYIDALTGEYNDSQLIPNTTTSLTYETYGLDHSVLNLPVHYSVTSSTLKSQITVVMTPSITNTLNIVGELSAVILSNVEYCKIESNLNEVVWADVGKNCITAYTDWDADVIKDVTITLYDYNGHHVDTSRKCMYNNTGLHIIPELSGTELTVNGWVTNDRVAYVNVVFGSGLQVRASLTEDAFTATVSNVTDDTLIIVTPYNADDVRIGRSTRVYYEVAAG